MSIHRSIYLSMLRFAKLSAVVTRVAVSNLHRTFRLRYAHISIPFPSHSAADFHSSTAASTKISSSGACSSVTVDRVANAKQDQSSSTPRFGAAALGLTAAAAATVTVMDQSVSSGTVPSSSSSSSSTVDAPSTDNKYTFCGTLSHLSQLTEEAQLRLTSIEIERSWANTDVELQRAAAAADKLWALVKASKALRVFSPHGALYVKRELDANQMSSLADALQHNRSIQRLDLSELRMSDNHAVVICKALESSTMLSELNLANNDLNDIDYSSKPIQGRGGIALSQLIQQCSTLTKLDIGFNNRMSSSIKTIADAAITSKSLRSLKLDLCGLKDEHAEILAIALQKPDCRLESLNIGRNGIGPSGVKHLSSAIATSHTFQSLNMEQNDIGPTGATSLADAAGRSKTLTSLLIGWCDIGVTGATAIAQAIRLNPRLQELGLESNKIGPEGAVALASALLQSRSGIHTLRLFDNGIGDTGATDLAAAVSAAGPVFRELQLDDNNIGTPGIRAVCDALPQCPSLETLNLSGNELNVDACAALATALPQSGVSTLMLSSCGLNPTKLSILVKGLIPAPQQQQEPRRRSFLTNLSLSVNEHLGDAGAEILAEALRKQTASRQAGVTCLDLHFSNMGDPAARALAAALPGSSLTELHIGGGTRKLSGKDIAHLGDEGVIALADALTRSNSMKILDLCTNFDLSDSIGAAGVAALLDALQKRDNSHHDPCRIWLMPGLRERLSADLQVKVDARSNFKF